MYLLTEFGRSVRENLAQGKRLIIIFRYSVILDHVIYLSNTSWCTLSLLWQHRGCETNNAHLQKFNCPCPPPTSRQWTYVIQGREYKEHTRPKRHFRTGIYYMGVVKNRELKWSFVGALEISSKLPPAEYFLLATCRACPSAILAQTQGSGYWQLNHWNRLTSETTSLLLLNPADTPQLTSIWKGPRRVSCFWVQSSFQVSLVLMRCPLLLVSVITLLNIWFYYQGKMIWHTFVYTTVKIWYIFTIEGLKNVHVISCRTNCKCSLKYFRPQF